VADASLGDTANVQQYTDNDNDCQQWSLNEVGNGLFEIINRNSGLVLDADLSNDNVIQYASWGGDNQRWKLVGTDDGTFFIVNLASHDVLGVVNAETGDGANVQHWVYNGLTCQQWRLIEVDADTGLTGDVNSDGNVDIVDALVVAQFYVGLNPDTFDQSKADTNCDGTIDILDALLIAQYYVGLITEFC
jgi:hypothetical protein